MCCATRELAYVTCAYEIIDSLAGSRNDNKLTAAVIEMIEAALQVPCGSRFDTMSIDGNFKTTGVDSL